MIRPKHTRKDENHPQIVKDCRALGMVVIDTADIGGVVLDVVVCWRGRCLPVEIKMPARRDQLTLGERVAIEELERVGVQAVVATCLEDVLVAFGAMVREEIG